MGFLDFIFGENEYVKDDFFGKMLLHEFKKNPKNSYFECSRYFIPIDKNIEIAITSNNLSVSEDQKDFFKKIEQNFNEIILKIKPVIEEEFRNWKEDFKIIDFKEEFTADYLTIPNLKNKPINWELTFSSIHDLNHIFTVQMIDFEVEGVQIDG